MQPDTLPAAPVVIIGSGRSGTNMLRDIVTSVDGVETWPCDEINYIWRHGNTREPTDAFTAEHARPEVVRYIRGRFAAISRATSAQTVVEKTCANSLRVGFVDAVLPEARYIHIVRDGRDVVASAMKRWTAELDLPYILKKVRYVPASDLPYYGTRYLLDRVHRLRTSERRLRSWGPRFPGMQDALATRTLAEVCALQWEACVTHAAADFEHIDAALVLTVRYTDFVHDPQAELARVLTFMGHDASSVDLGALTAGVSARSVGNWERDLSEADAERIAPIVSRVTLPAPSGLTPA